MLRTPIDLYGWEIASIEKRRVMFNPQILKWRGEVYDSPGEMRTASAKSAVGNGIAAGLIGLVGEGIIAFLFPDSGLAQHIQQNPAQVPVAMGVIGAFYGLMKRKVYEVYRSRQNKPEIPEDGLDYN